MLFTTNASLYIFNAIISVAFPELNEKFKSNILNDCDNVKNKHTVIPCLTIGIVTLLNVCHPLAPSICAASIKSLGTFSNADTYITIIYPAYCHVETNIIANTAVPVF